MYDPSTVYTKPGISLTDFIAPIIGLAQSGINYASQEKTNKANKEINSANIDYNTAMTQAQWERDDNAHQREVADLKAAGLSPLASTNGAGVTSALGAPSPIAMQAPQLETNALINSLLQNKALNETERHNKIQEGQKNIELENDAKEIELKAQQLDIENKKVEETIKYNAKYLKHLSDQLSETQRSNQAQEELKKLSIRSEEFQKSIQQQTGGKFNYKIYTDLWKYEAALSTWSTQFNMFIVKLKETSASSSSSSASSGGAGISVPVGTGTSFGINGNASGSGSSGQSQNISQKQQAMMDEWYHTHPMPVYIYYSGSY